MGEVPARFEILRFAQDDNKKQAVCSSFRPRGRGGGICFLLRFGLRAAEGFLRGDTNLDGVEVHRVVVLQGGHGGQSHLGDELDELHPGHEFTFRECHRFPPPFTGSAGSPRSGVPAAVEKTTNNPYSTKPTYTTTSPQTQITQRQ